MIKGRADPVVHPRMTSRACPGCRGRALTRIVVAALALAALVLVAIWLIPTREKRLWAFVDSCRDALLSKREDDFLAKFEAGVRYQGAEGLAEIRRDYKRYHAVGVPRPTVVSNTATLDDEGADVRLEVVLTAGFQPLGRYRVRMRLVDPDGEWRIVKVVWD
jgi:hypothetical protein